MGPEWYDKSILILGCGNRLLGDDGFGPEDELHLHFNDSPGVDDNIGFFVQDNGNRSTSQSYNDGEWHHVAAMWSTNAETYSVMVDGAVVRSGAYPVSCDFDFSQRVTLGRPASGFDRYFFGDMDETRLSGTVRSENWVWASFMTVVSNNVLASYSSAIEINKFTLDVMSEYGSPNPAGITTNLLNDEISCMV